MPYPTLPAPAPGEVLLICTCYARGRPQWGEVIRALGGPGQDGVLTLGGGDVRLRLAEHPGWDHLYGGHLPALLPEDGVRPPVAVVVDISAVYREHAVLLVDLREIPGRGARVPADRLGHVLTELLDGSLRFDQLVYGMDRLGVYQGDGGAPATPTPTTVVRGSFPQLPVDTETLLVRTDFTDDRGWRALIDALGEPNEYGWFPAGADLDSDDEVGLSALVVDDHRFTDLQPGQVPALVPPDEHTTMVALADTSTLADPAHPLLVVDLYDTPGQATRIPLTEAGLMAANLEIANMDFADFV